MSGKRAARAPAAPATSQEAPYDPTEDAAPIAAPAAGGQAPSAGSVTMYDASGEAHEVSAADAPSLLLGGNAYFQRGQTVHVKDDRGHIYALPAEKAGQAFAAGMQAATADDARAAVERKDQNTIGKTLEATGVGAARGLTMGLSDPLAIGAAGLVGGDSAAQATREHLSKLKEHHGVASTVGEVGGALAPLLLTGGGSAAAEGAEGAGILGTLGAAPRLTARAGELAAEGARGLLGTGAPSLLGRVAQRAIPMAAQGAVEGALYGAGGEVSRSALANEELTAEKLMAAAGGGALLGGGIGGGLGTVAELGSTLLNKMGSLGRATEGAAAQSRIRSLLRTGDENIDRTILATTDQEALPGAADYLRAGVKGENLTEVKALEQGAAARELRSSLNEMETSTKNLTPEWRELKADNVAKTVAKGEDAMASQAELATNRVGEMRQRLESMLADPAAYGDVGTLRKLSRHLDVADREIASAYEAGNNAEMFVALDNLKKKLGPLAKPGRMLSVAADQESAREVRGLYEGLRQTLTDPVWGGAAEMQRNVNGAFEQWLGTKKLFDQRFLTETGRDGWERVFGADPGKIEPYVKGIGASRNDLSQSIIEQHIANTKQLAQTLAKAGELTPEKAAELASIEKAAERFSKTVSEAQTKVGAIEQAEAVIAKAHEGTGALGAGAVGHMLGGPLGTVAGVGLKAATNPAWFLTQRVALEHAGGRVADLVGTVGGIDRIAEKTSDGLASAVGSFVLSRGNGKMAAPSLAAGQQKPSYQAHLEQLQDPQKTASLIADRVSPIAEHAPGVASAVASKMTATADYLRQHAPQPKDADKYAAFKPSTAPNDVDRAHFERVLDGTKPTKVVAHLKGMRLSSDEAKALQATSPKLYEEMAGKLLESIADRTAAGKSIDYDRIVQASTFVQVPLHPTLDPTHIKTTQSVVYQPQQQQQQQGSPRGAPKRQINIAQGFNPQSSLLTAHR